MIVIVRNLLRLLPRSSLLHLDIQSMFDILLHPSMFLATFLLFQLLLECLPILDLSNLFVHFFIIDKVGLALGLLDCDHRLSVQQFLDLVLPFRPFVQSLGLIKINKLLVVLKGMDILLFLLPPHGHLAYQLSLVITKDFDFFLSFL